MLPRINLYYTKSRKSRIWIDLVKLALNSNIHAKFALWTIKCDKMWQAFSFPISRKADLCIRGRFCCLFCNVPHHSFTDSLEQTATAAPSVSFEALSNSFPIAYLSSAISIYYAGRALKTVSKYFHSQRPWSPYHIECPQLHGVKDSNTPNNHETRRSPSSLKSLVTEHPRRLRLQIRIESTYI